MSASPPDHPNTRNPFFQKWETPFGVPPFDRIRPEHYLPAFAAGIRRHNEEIRAIARNRAAPTFANTMEALEDSGVFLDRVQGVFFALLEADSSAPLQAVALAVNPLLSSHQDDIHLNPALFERVGAVRESPQETLTPEGRTLVEKLFGRFRRGGAGLAPERQARLRAVHTELTRLSQQFEANLLQETNAFQLVVEHKRELKGLSPSELEAARKAAAMAGLDHKWAFTLHSSRLWSFLDHAENRELRRQLFLAYTSRCGHGSSGDNSALAAQIAALRAEKAHLLGFPSYAHFALADAMAKSPVTATRLLDRVWEPALARAKREARDLQALLDADAPGHRLEPWDWRFYAEKVRQAKYRLNGDALRPYFPLTQVRTGAFRVANRLYGITFNERRDLPTYHPEVHTYLVQDRDGQYLGVYFVDDHPRPGKRGGAWMETFRRQWLREGKDVRPLVYTVANFDRPVGEAPALLNLEEVRTLFHEFGHALHALLTRCRYRSLSGIATALDFSEMPSQIMENWAMEPEVLALYAHHYMTGAPLSPDLVARIQESSHFNQGFATSEFLAAAYLDMDWHALEEATPVDAAAFEAASMARIGLIPEIAPRYRTPYFVHSMGGELAAGYYAYLWSAILDSDAFQAFKETGNLFDPATAQRFRTHILEKGGSEDPLELYRRFRGRGPVVDPFLRKRGLDRREPSRTRAVAT